LPVDEIKIVNPRLDFKYDIENIHRYIKSTRGSYAGAKIKRWLTRRRRNEEHQRFQYEVPSHVILSGDLFRNRPAGLPDQVSRR
jgi:hypothetical protein